MEWSPDWGLRVRMVAVLASLFGLAVGFVFALLWTITDLLPWVTAAVFDVPLAVPDHVGMSVVAVLVAVAVAGEVSLGEKLTGDPESTAPNESTNENELSGTVTRLAQIADVPPPTVEIRPSRTPNAFTTGVTPSRSTIVLTTGLLDKLDDGEVEAVLAHELAHVKNRDVAVMTAASVVPFVAQRLIALSERVRHARLRRSRLFVLVLVASICLQVVAAAFWLLGRGLLRILSQSREFAADRGAAAIVGSPTTVAATLTKLDRTVRDSPSIDLRERDYAQMAFYVVPMAEDDDLEEYTGFGVAGENDGPIARLVDVRDAVEERVKDLFPTHPATEDRVARLQALGNQP